MTANAYYQKKIFLAQVNKNDAILGPIERWYAHREGILHRGFTVILTFKDQILLQHRRHPAFDGLWDFTFSSHQIFVQNKLQTDREAIYFALEREWNLKEYDVDGEMTKLGNVYYKAKDPNSIFTEHEGDYIYRVKIKSLPKPNMDYVYGYKLISSSFSLLKQRLAGYTLAPWVEKIIDEIHLVNL